MHLANICQAYTSNNELSEAKSSDQLHNLCVWLHMSYVKLATHRKCAVTAHLQQLQQHVYKGHIVATGCRKLTLCKLPICTEGASLNNQTHQEARS